MVREQFENWRRLTNSSAHSTTSAGTDFGDQAAAVSIARSVMAFLIA
jgi:hypothetical protein